MAIDLDALLTALETDPAARARVRQAVLSQDVLDLPARVERGFLQVAGQIGQLAARMAELAEDVKGLTERVDRLTKWMESANGRLGQLLGHDYEQDTLATPDGVEQAIGASFGTVRALSERERTVLLQGAVQAGRLATEAARDVRWANGVFLWEEPGQSPVVCIVEASVAAGQDDVTRASRRATVLTAAGIVARPVVLGDALTEEAKLAVEAGRVAWARVPLKRRYRPPQI